MSLLEYAANISAIFTALLALVGVGGYFRELLRWRNKKIAVEEYLRKRKEEALKKGKKGQFSALNVVRNVGVTEDELLKISFESDHIQRLIVAGEDGLASRLLFQYIE